MVRDVQNSAQFLDKRNGLVKDEAPKILFPTVQFISIPAPGGISNDDILEIRGRVVTESLDMPSLPDNKIAALRPEQLTKPQK